MYVCIHELQNVELGQNKNAYFQNVMNVVINVMNFILINMQIFIRQRFFTKK